MKIISDLKTREIFARIFHYFISSEKF